MPISIEQLDSSTTQENITLILGKNILLKIVENPEKKLLLEDNLVKKSISIPDLCYDDTRLLVEELIQMDKHRSMDLGRFLDTGFVETGPQNDSVPVFPTSGDDEEGARTAKMREAFEKIDFKDIINRLSEVQLSLVELLGKADKKRIIQQNMKAVEIGSKIKQATGFDILVPSNLLLCPTCGVILSTEEFLDSKDCLICKKQVEREQAERIYVHKVHDIIGKIWERNLWFEAYMARLLRKLNCKTWTGVHVMGASGILHEVDVLGIVDGTVLICECKTGKVSRNDVFNFCTKAGDLKTHVSILALIKELPEPETREFVEKNPAIIRIENMGRKKESKILDDLRQGLRISEAS